VIVGGFDSERGRLWGIDRGERASNLVIRYLGDSHHRSDALFSFSRVVLARCTAFVARNRWLGRSHNPSITYPSQSESQIQFGKSNRYLPQSIPPAHCSRSVILFAIGHSVRDWSFCSRLVILFAIGHSGGRREPGAANQTGVIVGSKNK
jgi:hypothetical protein